jgi:caa(3)-type oxidase subunit IV
MVDTEHEHGPGAPSVRLFLIVGIALAVFTAVSFIMNSIVRAQTDEAAHQTWTVIAFVVILGVAIVKATCVGTYFMHLKWDWRKVLFMIIPAFILGAMLVFVLMPDMVLAWHK